MFLLDQIIKICSNLRSSKIFWPKSIILKILQNWKIDKMNKSKLTPFIKQRNEEFVYSQNVFALYSKKMASTKTLETNTSNPRNSRPFSLWFDMKPSDVKHFRPYCKIWIFLFFSSPIMFCIFLWNIWVHACWTKDSCDRSN